MSNKEFFNWMHERLIYVYKESPNVDFVQSFKKRTDWLIQNTIGWISVKDRLPENDGWYLTCVRMEHLGNTPQIVCSLFFWKKYKRWENADEVYNGKVDYWMPIPKLPKEEENG